MDSSYLLNALTLLAEIGIEPVKRNVWTDEQMHVIAQRIENSGMTSYPRARQELYALLAEARLPPYEVSLKQTARFEHPRGSAQNPHGTKGLRGHGKANRNRTHALQPAGSTTIASDVTDGS